MNVGDRVRYSGHVINQKRDYWNSCGREPMKSGARKAPGLEIKWDDGTTSKCLNYLVITA